MPGSDDVENLDRLIGSVVPSEGAPGVTFVVGQCLGAGAVGVVFAALRSERGAETPVVLKVLRPSFVVANGDTALASIRKEAVALGRLNERVPPSPFVVRLIDTGELPFVHRMTLQLPWLAIEQVHGGEEGTTLAERVRFACDSTGSAFDPARAARALRCLASGIAAIHGVGVVHRDLTPGNVLCCGFGEGELFKISDFGVSRSVGMADTFGQVLLGTPGYAAPEQSFPTVAGVGPHSDVFSFGCLVYFILTGEPYFQARTLAQALILARAPERRGVAAGRFLAPELLARPDVCATLDRALAEATAYDPRERPQHVQYLAGALAPLLATMGSARPSQRHVDSVASRPAPVDAGGWRWTVRHAPGDPRVIYSAAWDADGACLAATTQGLEYWDGVRWVVATRERWLSESIRFVYRVGAGAWLLGAEDGTLSLFTFEGVQALGRAGAGPLRLVTGSGSPDDLLVTVVERDGGRIELLGMASRRWMKPLPVSQAASITTVAHVDDARWLVAGRSHAGLGFAALFDPLQWELAPLLVPPNRAFIASGGAADRGTGIVGGASGYVVHVERNHTRGSRLPDESDVSAVATDLFGRDWAASLGRIWLRNLSDAWSLVWSDPAWAVPFIRLVPDAGMLLALAADGAVLEGRAAAK